MSFALAMLVALMLDVAIGWPDALYRSIGHPVTWIGRLIARLELSFNPPEATPAIKRRGGRIALAITLGLTIALALLLQSLAPDSIWGSVLLGVLAWPLVAARAMYAHVVDVATPLNQGDVEGARSAVAMIVGRDPTQLDQAGIARATVESLAENTSDGITAPLFWGLLLGLPGIAAYKAINTLDSMIGHRNERYEDFGRASARLDDGVNFLPARLTALIFAAMSRRPLAALQTVRRDAHHHRSPNAGWPEAAMAGALGCRLSGPRRYHGQLTQDPFVNAACPDPTPADIDRALALFRRSMICLAALLLILAVL